MSYIIHHTYIHTYIHTSIHRTSYIIHTSYIAHHTSYIHHTSHASHIKRYFYFAHPMIVNLDIVCIRVRLCMVCVCVCLCMFVCMYVCMYVCMMIGCTRVGFYQRLLVNSQYSEMAPHCQSVIWIPIRWKNVWSILPLYYVWYVCMYVCVCVCVYVCVCMCVCVCVWMRM